MTASHLMTKSDDAQVSAATAWAAVTNKIDAT
jgi:hypothetical protein